MPLSSADVQVIFSPSYGSAMSERLPSETDTGSRRRKISRSASCSTGSACCMRFTKNFADPSRIGGSAASISTTQLSTPMPTSALRTCSIVWSLVCPEVTPVLRTRSEEICVMCGLISGLPKMSLRLKTIPVLTGAGFSVSVTAAAECRAVPLMEASRNIVRCFI